MSDNKKDDLKEQLENAIDLVDEAARNLRDTWFGEPDEIAPESTHEHAWLIECQDCEQIASMVYQDTDAPWLVPRCCPGCGSDDLACWPLKEDGTADYSRPGGKRPPVMPATA